MLPVYYIGMIFDKIHNLPYNSTIKRGENALSLTCTWFYIYLFEENNNFFERNIPKINPKKKCLHKKNSVIWWHFPALYKISIEGIDHILTYVWYMTAISVNLIKIRSSVLLFIWYSDISYKRDHQESDFNQIAIILQLPFRNLVHCGMVFHSSRIGLRSERWKDSELGSRQALTKFCDKEWIDSEHV